LQRVKIHDEQRAALASAKLEDGDVKGAVRLICSDDGLAAVNDNTLTDVLLQQLTFRHYKSLQLQ
jgi:hypothetical protein